MLSTQYRLRLEFICKKIANKEEVKLEDMIWAEKLSKANTTARDDFLVGLGDPDPVQS